MLESGEEFQLIRCNRALCEYLIEKLGITKGSLLPDSEGKYPSNLAREQGYEDLAFWLQAVIE